MPSRPVAKNDAAPPPVAAPGDLPALRASLLGWYRRHKRDLDWRRTSDPYRIWVSEVMLQQTRVATVTEYYRRWVARFPTVESLARAPLDAVLRHWAGLGYYSRARNLHRAAREIVAHHNGKFPRRLDDALALPGIGGYTAAAVLSIAYNQPLAVVDGNVARVIARLAALRGDARAPRAWRRLAATATALLDDSAPGDWNQAMMELGATLCTPRAPRCAECPLAGPEKGPKKGWCRARALGVAERIPPPRRKPAVVQLNLAAAVLLDWHGRTLLLQQQDAHAALFSRLWQFPAVAVGEPGVDRNVDRNNGAKKGAKKKDGAPKKNPKKNNGAQRDLSAHLRRSFGLAPGKLDTLGPLASARHAVTFRDIRLLPFLLRVDALPRVPGARTRASPMSHACRYPAPHARLRAPPSPACGRQAERRRLPRPARQRADPGVASFAPGDAGPAAAPGLEC